MNITPTPKMTAVGTVGGAIVLLLQICQQYWPSFHPPTAATLSTIITAVLVVAGWIKRDMSSPNPPPVKLPPAVGPALPPPATPIVQVAPMQEPAPIGGTPVNSAGVSGNPTIQAGTPISWEVKP